MERRLAAIMATDVVGYSRLIRADEEGTLAALKALRADLIDPKIAEHHGRIVKLMGDGMLVEFASVVDAVHAAVETQQAVSYRNADVPADKRIELRIGINLGDVVIDGDDIQGDGINVAARLEGMAEPGGICVSGMVYEGVRDRIDIPFEDLGEQKVKNIDRPVRVWRWVTDGVAAAGTASADKPLPLPDKPSIAVLPFNNMSGDADQDYFSDGITEDIITGLSRFRNLFVIARSSSFTYKGRAVNVRDVGRDLGVHYILEGSVRRAGNRIRVTAQLIDAETGHHIWADRYDRKLEDIFAVQDELTETIAATLEMQVGVAAQGRATRKTPQNLGAYDFVLRGHAIIVHTFHDNLRAREMFEQALRLDPGCARAWVALASSHMIDFNSGWGESPEDSLDEALRHARKAAQLDSADSYPYRLMTNMHSMKGQYDDALNHARRALRLNPNDADAYASLAQLLTYLGQPGEALDAVATAMRLNPHHPSWYWWHNGFAMIMAGDCEAALTSLKEALSRYPGFVTPHRHLAVCYMRLGQEADARNAVADIIKLEPAYSLQRLSIRLPFKHLEDRERYLDDLRRAGVPDK